ncbi:uncharacterized protein LOC123513889 [Portunus trituberculatus]|uniref:Protein Star n=1 Tax=Portunus trituberculatus TaxID=210409 RepID=A0A5B7J0U8_PORTR|nr:uncharacterized protein LOC123513889 [Portunus trituberculatus]XP_045127284.1 uncharacterized protein LOC123513889 [Portunus trituberculatus]MPC86094.1 Protein Star [Portunus trituberculatus]
MKHHILVRVLCLLLLVVLLSCVPLLMLEAKVSPSGRRFLQSREQEVWARLEGPLEADDSQVLLILKQNFLAPPSSLPYNFSGPMRQIGSRDFSWPWIHEQLLRLFGKQRGGFFVEAGALDGEYLSNTLWLERRLGWTGLLVEPDEESYKMLVSKHRRAWTSNTCLSKESFPRRTILVSRRVLKGATHEDFWWAFRGQTHEMGVDFPNKESLDLMTDSWYSKVQCFPLLSYLLVLNITTVDLLSLDVQGTENAILHTLLASSQVSVRVIVVEDEKKTFDHAFMASHGYVLVASDFDHVYVKKGDPALNSAVTAAVTPTAVNHISFVTATTTTAQTAN